MANVALDRLKARIVELGGEEEFPVVPIEMFFDQNEDEASIGPSVDPYPGLPAFERVLSDIRDRPDVSGVAMEINEALLDTDGEWPFVSRVHVITTADAETVAGWASALQPDPPEDDVDSEDWSREPPPGAPPVPPGYRVSTLNWD